MFGGTAKLRRALEIVDKHIDEGIGSRIDAIRERVEGKTPREFAEDPVFQKFIGELCGLAESRAVLALVTKGSNPPERYLDESLPDLLGRAAELGAVAAIERMGLVPATGEPVSALHSVYLCLPAELKALVDS